MSAERSNVHGVCNGDLLVRHDGLRGHVTGVWNESFIQVLWDRPGPSIFNSDGFTMLEVQNRFRPRAEGGWEILAL